MKEAILVLRDRQFLLDSLRAGLRWDGRDFFSYREPRISFGREWGSAFVALGETKILANTRYDLVEPRESRPNEGTLQVNVDYSPVCGKTKDSRKAGPWFEMQRTLDKLVRDCRFVDLESLCVVAGKEAWEVSVDLNVLGDDGNMLECASIAMLAALKHFRHPETTMDGDRPVIHSTRDREPASLTFTHTPVFSSFSFLQDGKVCLADPTEAEESTQEGKLMIAANTFSEICGFHQAGIVPCESLMLKNCCHLAVRRAKHVVEVLKAAIAEDKSKRDKREKVGFDVEMFMCVPGFTIPEDLEDDRRSEAGSVPEGPAAAMDTDSESDEPSSVRIKEEPTDEDGAWGLEDPGDEVEEVERRTADDRVLHVELGDAEEDEAESDASGEDEGAESSSKERRGKGKGGRGSSKSGKWFSDQW